MTHAHADHTHDDGRRGHPPSMTTTLHIGAEHVSASDLTDRHTADLASLALGDHNTRVVLLGSLATLRAIVQTATRQLDDIENQRHRTT